MPIKRLIDPRRMRKGLPRGFGWIDHRLLQDGYLSHCSPQALVLYVLLVCASDAQGLSYYSCARIAQLLSLEPVSDFLRCAFEEATSSWVRSRPQVKRCLSKGFFVQWFVIDNHTVQIKKNGLQVVSWALLLHPIWST